MNMVDFRQKAEQIVSSDNVTPLELEVSDDVATLIHELKVHQVELELQNEELRRAQIQLQTAQNKYFSLYNFAPIGFFTFDSVGLILEVNLVGAELLGQTRQRLLRKPFMIYLHNQSHETFYLHRQLVLETRQPQLCELVLRQFPLVVHQAKPLYIQMKSIVVLEADNAPVIHAGVIDITERKEAEAKLRKYYDQLEQTVAERTSALTRSNQQLQIEITQRLASEQALRQSKDLITAIYDTVHTGICLTNQDGLFVEVNRAYMQIYGYAYEELIGHHFTLVVLPEQRDAAIALHDCFLEGEPELPAEWQVRRKDGQVITIEVTANLLIFENQQRFKVTAISDITQRKKAENELKYQAYHDSLTGLPNRVAFMAELDKALKRAKAEPDFIFAVLFLDLNGFKLINDSLGHLAGDEMLITVAKRLRKAVYSQDIVARLGGDEFTILVNGIDTIVQAERVADRINEELAHPIYLAEQPIFASASIGIASNLTAYSQAADLLRDADTAMYQAKASGRGQHKHFDVTQHLQAVAQLQLESELWQALKQQEFVLYYQPIADLLTGQVTILEVVTHWQHPQRGLLAPEYFLNNIEQMNAMLPFRQQITRLALQQLHLWSEAELPQLQISINLSSSILHNWQFIDFLVDILLQYSLPPDRIWLEIPDQVNLVQILRFKNPLMRLNELGFRIVLDNFSMGTSSLQIMRELPLHGLKIGPQFVGHIGESKVDEAIVTAIIGLAHQLGLTVIAEGVETNAQFQFLKELQCHKIQGSWVGARMSVEKMTAWLQTAQI